MLESGLVEPGKGSYVERIKLPYDTVSNFLHVTRKGEIVLAGKQSSGAWELRAVDGHGHQVGLP